MTTVDPPRAVGSPPIAVPSSRRWWWGLAGVAVGAAALRVWVVLVHRPTTEAGGGGYVLAGDSVFYHWQARAIAAGRGFLSPLAYAVTHAVDEGRIDELPPGVDPDLQSAGHPPLYPLYLAAWVRLGVTSVTGHRLVSSLLGVATVVLIALFARRLAGDRAGLIAGAIAAVYPQLWINDGMLMSETVAAFVTVCMLFAAHRAWHAPGRVNAVLLGAGVSLAALARAELLVVFPLVVIPLTLWRPGGSLRYRIGLLALAAAAAIAVLGPWVGYNLSRFEQPVLLSNGAGAALSASYCDQTFYGNSIGYWANCLDPTTVPDGLDESERDAFARDHALSYLREHWTRLPVVAAARVGRVWAVFKPGQTTRADWWIEGRGETPSRLGTAGFYTLAPLAIAGGLLLRRRGHPTLPYLAIAAAVTAAAAITFGLTRYRVPVEVTLAVLAAIGADAILRHPHPHTTDPHPTP